MDFIKHDSTYKQSNKELSILKILALIPVYKSPHLLNKFEVLSIKNALYRLQINCDVAFVGPQRMQTEYIFKYPQIKYYIFKDKYFQDISGYNSLLKSLAFYKKYDNYNDILIAQTDAWIFGDSKDLLHYTNFDYCGAISFHNNLAYGYNGGLSLRNVKSSIKALKSFKNYESPEEIWKRHFPEKKKTKPYKIISFLLDVLIRKKVHHRLNFFTRCNEDIFWSVFVPRADSNFKVISPEEAIKFSWEHNCEEFEKKYSLPFGCHGWWNYNYEFWKEIIKIETEVKN